MLNAPLKMDELLLESQMANIKAPGTDGLPIETYKQHSKTLMPGLLETLNESFRTGCLPESMKEAVVVVLPKPGKDPLQK